MSLHTAGASASPRGGSSASTVEHKIREIKRLIDNQIDTSWRASSTPTPVNTAAPHRFNFDSLQLLQTDSILDTSYSCSAHMTYAKPSEFHNRGEVITSQALAAVPTFGSWKHQEATASSPSSQIQPSPGYSEQSGFTFSDAYSSPSRIPRPHPGYKRQHRRPSSGDGSQDRKTSHRRGSKGKARRYLQTPVSPDTSGVAMTGDISPSLANISELTDEFGQLTCKKSLQPASVLAIEWTPSHRFLLSPAYKKLKPDPSNWREMTKVGNSVFKPSGSVYSYPQACNPSPCARLNFAGSPKPKQPGRQPKKAVPKVYEFDPDLDTTRGVYLDMSDPELTESEDSGKCSSKSSLSKDQIGEAYQCSNTFVSLFVIDLSSLVRMIIITGILLH